MLNAYCTLVPRLKERTDKFVLSQEQSLKEAASLLSQVQKIQKAQVQWLQDNLSADFLKVMARSDYLDRNGIWDPTYITNTFDRNRIISCKLLPCLTTF
jgi:hypothetical protein